MYAIRSYYELLAVEIAKRYYYQKGAIEVGLKKDAELSEGLALLKDLPKYKGLLNGQVASHAGDKPKR